MREALKNAVQSAILFECQLPHQESGLGKSCLSSQNDICFNNTDPQEIAKVMISTPQRQMLTTKLQRISICLGRIF